MMRWRFFVRGLAAAALVACLFLPVSTCTHRGQTRVTVPIHDIKPVAEVLLVYGWPVLLLIAEALRPRLSKSRIVLVFVQVLLAPAAFYMVNMFTLFETPAIGFHIAVSALTVYFVAALIEGIDLVRKIRKQKLASAPAPA